MHFNIDIILKMGSTLYIVFLFDLKVEKRKQFLRRGLFAKFNQKPWANLFPLTTLKC